MPPRKSIVVVDGHPDPASGHFCHAIADAYRRGAEAAGHHVILIEVSRLEFPLLRSPEHFENALSPESLIPARDAILSADHMVVVFPLWLGSMPALLKGFLEQVLHKDTAFEPTGPGEFPKGRLKGKSARVIVTMGMPAFFFRLWYMAHGLKSLERNILRFIGFKPVRDTIFGMVDRVSSEKRNAWLRKIEAMGKKAI
ncbi:NAD(P)H-dependent oxidoreductase [Roseibium polysiphoniae]|uniref:NAD(P)H-dependent oxidoreductase n=1 Tax=Roseibium polysiphoniae TaxID=2571221 RepID=UPI0032981A83